jgi:hypothetical protein
MDGYAPGAVCREKQARHILLNYVAFRFIVTARQQRADAQPTGHLEDIALVGVRVVARLHIHSFYCAT